MSDQIKSILGKILAWGIAMGLGVLGAKYFGPDFKDQVCSQNTQSVAAPSAGK